MAIHPSTLAWRIPWTEEPSRLPSTGSQRVRPRITKGQTQDHKESDPTKVTEHSTYRRVGRGARKASR